MGEFTAGDKGEDTVQHRDMGSSSRRVDGAAGGWIWEATERHRKPQCGGRQLGGIGSRSGEHLATALPGPLAPGQL